MQIHLICKAGAPVATSRNPKNFITLFYFFF